MDLIAFLDRVPPETLGTATLDVLVAAAAARRDTATLTRLAGSVDLDSAAAGIIAASSSAQVRRAWIARPDLPVEARGKLLAGEKRVTVLRAAGQDESGAVNRRVERSCDKARTACQSDAQAMAAALRAGKPAAAAALLARLMTHAPTIGDVEVLSICVKQLQAISPATVATMLDHATGGRRDAGWMAASALLNTLPVEDLLDLLGICSEDLAALILSGMDSRWRGRTAAILADSTLAADVATRDRLTRAGSDYVPTGWMTDYALRTLPTDVDCLGALPDPEQAPDLWRTVVATLQAAHPTLGSPKPAAATRDWLTELADAWSHGTMPDELAVALAAAMPDVLIDQIAIVPDQTDIATAGLLGAIEQQSQWADRQVDHWWEVLNAAVADNAWDPDVIASCAPIALHPSFTVPTGGTRGDDQWIDALPLDRLDDWPASLVIRGMERRRDAAVAAAHAIEQLVLDGGAQTVGTVASLSDTFPGTWGQMLTAARYATAT